MKHGDVFRWCWNDAQLEKRRDKISAGTIYWCMSRFCIARTMSSGEIRLFDTYWSTSDNTEVDQDRVDLEFLGNIGDFESANHTCTKYYDKKDILDISHANNSRAIYIRKGAERSLDVIRCGLLEKIQESERQIESLSRNIERMKADLAGDLTNVYY